MRSNQKVRHVLYGVACGAAVPLLLAILAIADRQFSEFLAGILFAIGIYVLPALLFAVIFIKIGWYNKTFLWLLFWSNIIAWVVPALGIAIGVSTSLINRHNTGEDRRKYFVLGAIGYLLGVAHLVARVTNLV